MTNRKIEYWVIPPEGDAEFVAGMEEVLDTYEKAYGPNLPVICMDAQLVQLIGETRVPIPATKEHPERVDYEYERLGVNGQHFHVRGTAFELSSGDLPSPTNQHRLGVGSRPLAGQTLCQQRSRDPRVRQSEYSHPRSVLRSLPAGQGTRVCSTHRVRLHSETWQLAQHRGM